MQNRPRHRRAQFRLSPEPSVCAVAPIQRTAWQTRLQWLLPILISDDAKIPNRPFKT